jgi:hypothetical protein
MRVYKTQLEKYWEGAAGGEIAFTQYEAGTGRLPTNNLKENQPNPLQNSGRPTPPRRLLPQPHRLVRLQRVSRRPKQLSLLMERSHLQSQYALRAQPRHGDFSELVPSLKYIGDWRLSRECSAVGRDQVSVGEGDVGAYVEGRVDGLV